VVLAGSPANRRHAELTKLIAPYNFLGHITSPFVFGAGLIIAGALIRLRCFREMGRHFTFALSLRDNHTLITTGPYAVVRHPAYTGGNMTVLGAVLTLMYDGSWWFAGGYATAWGRFLALNFIVSGLLVVRACLRGHKEDDYLKTSFGEQWERFEKQVPHRYIPGVC
jgi:protein-S-isoprenylcysteine O-methyltransferase Ste14